MNDNLMSQFANAYTNDYTQKQEAASLNGNKKSKLGSLMGGFNSDRSSNMSTDDMENSSQRSGFGSSIFQRNQA